MFCKSLLPTERVGNVGGRLLGIHHCPVHDCNCTPGGHLLPDDVECEDGFRLCDRCPEFEALPPPKEETFLKRQRNELAPAKLTGPKLTIGLPYFRDYSGLWATVQSLSFYHSEAARECEIIVIDNDPEGNPYGSPTKDHSAAAAGFCQEVGIRYVQFSKVAGTAAAKGHVFELARAPAVAVLDCHVMLMPGVLRRLVDLFTDNAESKDLFQGPYVQGNGRLLATHMSQQWSHGIFGKWAIDQRVRDQVPFPIHSMGCGLFACNKHAWPGFHPLLRGFGPEEGHLQDRVRRNGGHVWCLPWLLWHHRPQCPDRKRAPNFTTAEMVRGSVIISLDTNTVEIDSLRAYFVDDNQWLTREQFDAIVDATIEEFENWKTASMEPEVSNAETADESATRLPMHMRRPDESTEDSSDEVRALCRETSDLS